MESKRGKLPHRVLFACGDDKVLGLLVLQHQPHTVDIVRRIAPVTECIEIAQVKLVLQSQLNACCCHCDLAGDEVLAPSLTLMVKEDPVDRKHTVALPVVANDPVGVELSAGVGRAGAEGRQLILRSLRHVTI